ncbi:MAG: hypothetical protein LBS99_06520 [Clostridiales bacterium]|jgi:protein arginine kinase activator|nr:hypothetical protein [Clostridiales bacterium]
MKCQNCGAREGTARSVIIDGKRTQGYFCQACSEKMVSKYRREDGLDVIGGIFTVKLVQPEKQTDLICEVCGTGYGEFVQTGFVGCPDCYRSFEPYIGRAISGIQEHSVHLGKTPDGRESNEYESLYARFEQALAEKDYHEAARLQDLIAQLKQGGK